MSDYDEDYITYQRQIRNALDLEPLPQIDQMLAIYPGISAVKVDIQKSPALFPHVLVFLRYRQSSCLFRKRKPCGKMGHCAGEHLIYEQIDAMVLPG